MITVLGQKVSLQDLAHAPLTRPERAGARWQGINHYALARTLLDSLQQHSVEVTRALWSLDSTGNSLVGGVQVRFADRFGIAPLRGLEYALAIRHTNDLRHALQIAVGARVMACQNGVVTGRFVLTRKHTSGLDLSRAVDFGVERFIDEAKHVGNAIEEMKRRSLTTRQSDHLLMNAGRQGLLAWSHIGQAHEEYAKPTYEAFKPRNAWSLYNSFNEIAKKVSPSRQLDALDRFRQIVLN